MGHTTNSKYIKVCKTLESMGLLLMKFVIKRVGHLFSAEMSQQVMLCYFLILNDSTCQFYYKTNIHIKPYKKSGRGVTYIDGSCAVDRINYNLVISSK